MSGDGLQPEAAAVAQEAEALLGGADVFQRNEVFFSTWRRTTRRRIKSIKALLPTLRRALDPKEKVRFVSASGYMYYLWEQFLGAGVWAAFVNATTVVLTDRRLLAFNVEHRSRAPKDIKNAIPFSGILSVRRFAGTLTLRLRDRRKLRVTGLPFADAGELRARLARELENPAWQAAGASIGGKSLQYLCPACCRPVEGTDAERCASCRVEFRSGRTAALRSLLLPGLGDIYLKHTLLGVLELIGSVIVWLVVLDALLSGEPDSIIIAAVLFVMVNVTDYFVTKAMARKGIIAK